tara:strand:- start:1402 stop:1548 length:147 start_codon:yes stop_codon:yes gene_type:complete
MDTRQKLIEEIIALKDDMTAKELYWFAMDLQELDISLLINIKKKLKNG